ncbi:esterase-like activity of phytase family protein [Pseudomonas sp. nanlin1]|uniref:esterase-like activity of phytase family protein n=1 Tax=Pseudomonas sp. nanlin1 TaxID=3040605 RepID=UPI003890A204
MRQAWAALLLLAGPVLADAPASPTPVELSLVSEHVIAGMARGNLSGLAQCGDALWAVSDRDDHSLYRLATQASPWQAEAIDFQPPSVPDSGLPWGLRVRTWVMSFIRGGDLDFEGLSCDAQGSAYLVSEAHAAVLKVPVSGSPEWLRLSPSLVRQARGSGMLLHFNALFEGVAVNGAGDHLWLAAERERRGLLVVKRQQTAWDCEGGCVLLSEAGTEPLPAQMNSSRQASRDFSDLAYFNGKLFTLERNAYQICRRNAQTAALEQCWSFAAEALAPQRRYDQPFGLAEALVVDASGAWVGLDNNEGARADGERRPVVWRFAAPAGGWGAVP